MASLAEISTTSTALQLLLLINSVKCDVEDDRGLDLGETISIFGQEVVGVGDRWFLDLATSVKAAL